MRQLWVSIIERWSALTSGTTRGTSGTIRNALEFEITAHPAAANFGSSSRAISASRAAKIIFGNSPKQHSGIFGCSVIAAIVGGNGVSSFHRQASPYVLPA